MTDDILDQEGIDFARQLLYVPWVADDDTPRAKAAWVSNCPDDIEPRSVENPYTFTFEETLTEDWGIGERQQWYIIGAKDPELEWHGIDWDGDEEHAETVDHSVDDLQVQDHTLKALSKSNYPHAYWLSSSHPNVKSEFDGIDLLGSDGSTTVRGAISPWHDDRREVLNNPPIRDFADQLFDDVGDMARIAGEPVLSERDSTSVPVDVDVPDEAPSDMPDAVHHLAEIRSSDMRHMHNDPFDVDKLLAMTCFGFGYSKQQTFELFKRYPPAKKGGFDPEETQYQLDNIWRKMESEELSRPTRALEKYGIDYVDYPDLSDNHFASFPDDDVLHRGGDKQMLWQIRREYAQQARLAIEQDLNGHLVGPKGCGKTYSVVQAAKDHLVAAFAPTTAKYEEIIEEALENGLPEDEILRLPSWPVHADDGLKDDWEDTYYRGAFPREIYSWEDDDVEDEYTRLSDLDFEDYSLLIGAPEHANLKSVVEDRIVFFDDSELTAFRSTFDEKHDGGDVNELLKHTDYESWQQLERSGSWHDVSQQLINHFNERGEFDSDDIFEALTEIQSEPDAGPDRREILRKTSVNLDALQWIRALTGELDYNERTYYDSQSRLVLVQAPDMTEAEQVFTMGARRLEPEIQQAFDDMNVTYDGTFGSDRLGDMERAVNRVVLKTSSHQHCKSDPTKRHNPERTNAIAEGVKRLAKKLEINEDVQMFSTKAEARHLAEDLQESDTVHNYGDITGSNRWVDKHLAVVGGSQHFGDDYIHDKLAYAGLSSDVIREGFQPARWTSDVAAEADELMRTSGFYEAITRMGRNDTDLTIVAADTERILEYCTTIDVSDRVLELTDSEEALARWIDDQSGSWQIKQQGEGAVDALDYSAPTLYKALDTLLDEGVVEVAGDGAYGATKYTKTEELEELLVNPGVKGLQTAGLTSEDVSEATNPDWDITHLEPEANAPDSPAQRALTEFKPGD